MTWKGFIAFIMRASFLPEAARQQVHLEVLADVRHQILMLWEHRIWDTVDITSGHWPNVAGHRYQVDARPLPAETGNT